MVSSNVSSVCSEDIDAESSLVLPTHRVISLCLACLACLGHNILDHYSSELDLLVRLLRNTASGCVHCGFQVRCSTDLSRQCRSQWTCSSCHVTIRSSLDLSVPTTLVNYREIFEDIQYGLRSSPALDRLGYAACDGMTERYCGSDEHDMVCSMSWSEPERCVAFGSARSGQALVWGLWW